LEEPVGCLIIRQPASAEVCVAHYGITTSVCQSVANQPVADTTETCNQWEHKLLTIFVALRTSTAQPHVVDPSV
jgi:hypothetical protein